MSGTAFRAAALACGLLAAGPLAALPLPNGANQVFDETKAPDSYAVPVAPFDGKTVPSRTIEGRVERTTWRLPPGSGTSLAILSPMRSALRDAGFDIVLDCADRACGGFDFRFGIEVIPTPDMYVNLREFRFLSAIRGDAEATTLLISVSPSAAYVQQISVTPQPGDG